MMLDWNSYRTALGTRVGEFAKLTPDTLRGLQVMEGAGAKTGKLEPKVHELIALAVAVTTRCDGCIAFHAKAAMGQAPPRKRSPRRWEWPSRSTPAPPSCTPRAFSTWWRPA